MLTSYAAEFAATWGQNVREIIAEYGQELFGISLHPDYASRSDWRLAPPHLGGMVTAGAGGPITGRGASLFVIDDPIKNQEEAASEVIQAKLPAWYQSTVQTRMDPDGVIVLMQTRWNENDLGGWLLREDNPPEDPWTVLTLPAIATEDEDYGVFKRRKGDALCPERWPVQLLETRRRSAGPYYWAAMFQQTPVPEGGGILKAEWVKKYRRDGQGHLMLADRRRPLTDGTIFMTVDPAISEKSTADYTVIAVWFWDGVDLVLLDLERRRMQAPDINPAVKALRKAWNAAMVYYEPVAFQMSLIQYGRREGIPALEIPKEFVARDKVANAHAAAPLMADGRFWVPADAPWLAEYIRELAIFPNGAHDDQVDVTTYAVAIAERIPGRKRKWDRKEAEDVNHGVPPVRSQFDEIYGEGDSFGDKQNPYG